MTHFTHALEIEASPAAIYAAITTAAGLRGWWTETCDVVNVVGGHHVFRFGPHHKTMRVDKLIPNREVRWTCVDANIVGLDRPDEWIGTSVRFRMQPNGAGRTRLDFEHVGLTPALECYGICEDGWRHFLASLKSWLETGQGTPYEAQEAVHG